MVMKDSFAIGRKILSYVNFCSYWKSTY